MTTNADRVIQFLASISPKSASNEIIVARTGVRPHQQVFQITQSLLRDGRIAGRQLGRQWEFWFPATDREPAMKLDGRQAVVKDLERRAAPDSDRPKLTVARLAESGFALVARWCCEELSEKVAIEGVVPKHPGVYAFAISGVAVYVGVAKMGLSKRLYFYGNPGATQRTSQRLNQIIRETLRNGLEIEIYTAQPQDLEWNGLPVSGIAGLEVGLIKSFYLTWNIRAG